MTVWNKLITAFKGHAHNAAESLQDANLLTILDQEVREAKQAISKAKNEKAKMSANRIMKEKSIAEIMDEAQRRTEAARKAKQQGDEALAVEIIESILKLKEKAQGDEDLLKQYQETEQRMDASIRQSQNKIENLERKIASAKANEALINSQKAASTSSVASNGKLASAVDSLEKLEARQAHQQAMLDVAEEDARIESGVDLEEKIKKLESPKTHDVQELLAKL